MGFPAIAAPWPPLIGEVDARRADGGVVHRNPGHSPNLLCSAKNGPNYPISHVLYLLPGCNGAGNPPPTIFYCLPAENVGTPPPGEGIMKPPNFCYAGSNCHGLSRGQPLRARNRYIRRGWCLRSEYRIDGCRGQPHRNLRRPRRPAKTTEYLPSIIVGNAFMHSASQHANGTDKSVPYSYRICATKECRDAPSRGGYYEAAEFLLCRIELPRAVQGPAPTRP